MVDVAVCVGFRPRNDHEQTLWDWCRQRWETVFPDWPVHTADSGHDPFNRSASRNRAADAAGDVDVYVFANADTTFLNSADMVDAAAVAATGQWVLPACYVETAAAYTDETVDSDPRAEMVDPLSDYERQLPDSPAGPQIMSRAAFVEANGWDERFVWGWGREDWALMIALDTLCGPHVRVGTAVHLWHPRGRDDSFHAAGYPRCKAYALGTYGRAARRPEPQRVDAMRRVIAGNRP